MVLDVAVDKMLYQTSCVQTQCTQTMEMALNVDFDSANILSIELGANAMSANY